MKAFQLISLGAIEIHLKMEIAGFSRLVVPSLSNTYIEERFAIYDQVITSRRNGALTAVQFLNTFTRGKDRYVYLGSLFSRNAAFLPLFMSWLSDECHKFKDSNIYLLAEFQNPELFLLYKSIFHQYSYPCLEDEPIPGTARKTSELFSQHIPHIHGLDTRYLSTRSGKTLYTYKKKYGALMPWLEQRAIFPGRGDNQVLLVNLETGSRSEVLEILNTSDYPMSYWYGRMKNLLLQIEENV
jgi:hypothetical protein